MGSQFSSQFQTDALPELLAEFGESIAVLEGGVSGRKKSITAIVAFDETRKGQHGEQSLAVTIKVATGTEITRRDVIEIGREAYRVTMTGKERHGLTEYKVTRYEGEQRTEARNVL